MVFDPLSSVPFASGNALGIAIAGSSVTRSKRRRHTAFIYRDKDQQVNLFHFGWHRILRHHPWDQKYYWVEFSNLNIIAQESLAENLVALAIVNGAENSLLDEAAENCEIPYSAYYSPSIDYFDEDLRISALSVGDGLTCATFIVAVLKRFSIPLVDIKSWPPNRLADKSFLDYIVKQLAKIIGLKDHALYQLRYKSGLKRFRPEEVAVAPMFYVGEALTFQDIKLASEDLLRILPK